MKAISEKLGEFISKLKEDSDFRKRVMIIGSAILAALIIIIIIIVCVSGSKKKRNTGDIIDETNVLITPTPTPTPTLTPTPSPTLAPTATPTPTPDLHPGQTRSYLTGEWVDDQIVKTRPYCIMFNNIGIANPQSGVGDAKILYEALTEAGITRLMGVFEGLTLESSCAERIGSVRSARHYFASFADEYDSIFIHYGETTYATKKIDKLKLDHLEGTYGIGNTVYYRDKSIAAPHNAFASLEGIWAGIEKLGLRTEHPDDYKPNHFVFNEENVPAGDYTKRPASEEESAESGAETTKITNSANVSTAEKITLPYSTYMTVTLDYDPETRLYTRNEFGGVHVDYNTNEPLRFTNVIVQIVHEYNKDKNGYQDMDISSHEGKGYYISGGKCVPITWKKSEKKRYMYYYDENGEVLSINEGRTFISVFPDFREEKLLFE
ncbi:MAG: DUF3048 domain-containing protein [Lachnospiraceae bacterium]|nr:DUF3048 domain-containing protein [Lachnospiraceae bacterium]